MLLLATACADPSDAGPPGNGGAAELRLIEIASGLEAPTHLISPPQDSRLFILEQAGRIRVVRDGRLLDVPFLDITDRMRSGGERGLLGLAFHPRYIENGFFYVNYTDLQGDTRIERYTAAAGADLADVASAKLILQVEQPFGNHNGGLVAFGPDDMLYIGMGDGGASGDPQGHGQNRGTLLGALLRIDVDGGDPYAIPGDNPFAGRPGMRGEIWAWGLRNPWRFAFDAEDGLLYVADVGQNAWEEVNIQPATLGGLNYGWNIMEGDHCYNAATCDRSGLTLPGFEYGHDEGCSVTGGYVYRGARIPALDGHYFFGDYCEGWIRSLRYVNGEVAEVREWPVGEVSALFSFGVDAGGELYVLSGSGRVYRFDPAG